MAITEKEVEHIAKLARIRLKEAEKKKLTRDLGAILGYIDKLKEVDTENVEPVAHITGLENVLKKDEKPIRNNIDQAKEIIDQAPATEDGYVKVKSVFEDK